MLAKEILFGMTDDHIRTWAPSQCGVHQQLLDPLTQLQHSAAEAGFALRVASGFRSYQRQLAIWNAKASGARPVLDSDGKPLVLAQLSARQQVFAILRWSALPGGSRHHWGTDIDVFDANGFTDAEQLQLMPQEYDGDGPCAGLSAWLDAAIASGAAGGFVRPYAVDRGGVAPEPWHLSYAPVANLFQQQLRVEALYALVEASDLLLKEAVLANLDDIYERFIALPPAA